jgi:hypothetical protein
MLDYADPCAVGPLYCNVGCRADSDVESVSLFSGFSRRSRATNATVDLEEPTSHHDALRKRISIFESKGWLSQQEHRKYMALMSTAPTPKENAVTEHVLMELEKELNQLEERMSGGTMLNKQTRMSILTPRMSERPSRALGVFPEPKTARKAASFGSITNKRASPPIADPSDLSNDLSEHQISELFVETCFFARLGFVQPPCCLQCTYRESMKEAVPNTKCGRWLIWRRDAKHVLHPNHLCDNAIAVQCHAARRLLAGKTVDNHRWDNVNKIMVEPRTFKSFQPRMCAP